MSEAKSVAAELLAVKQESDRRYAEVESRHRVQMSHHEHTAQQIAELSVDMSAMKRDMGSMKRELETNTMVTARTEANTAGAVELLRNIETLVKALGWIGKALKWLAQATMVVGTLAGAAYALKTWMLK